MVVNFKGLGQSDLKVLMLHEYNRADVSSLRPMGHSDLRHFCCKSVAEQLLFFPLVGHSGLRHFWSRSVTEQLLIFFSFLGLSDQKVCELLMYIRTLDVPHCLGSWTAPFAVFPQEID